METNRSQIFWSSSGIESLLRKNDDLVDDDVVDGIEGHH